MVYVIDFFVWFWSTVNELRSDIKWWRRLTHDVKLESAGWWWRYCTQFCTENANGLSTDPDYSTIFVILSLQLWAPPREESREEPKGWEKRLKLHEKSFCIKIHYHHHFHLSSQDDSLRFMKPEKLERKQGNFALWVDVVVLSL